MQLLYIEVLSTKESWVAVDDPSTGGSLGLMPLDTTPNITM